MKLYELLDTYGNHHYIKKGEIFENRLFTAKLYFEDWTIDDNLLERDYTLKANYNEDKLYISKYKEREVVKWFCNGNDLIITIKGKA